MIIILKPTYACNYRCKYCYLTNNTKSSCRRFDAAFAKRVLIQAKDYVLRSKRRELNIIWHGGEPLLWGIDNYRDVFDFMAKELQGLNYKNSMQTNLSLINDDYIELFHNNNVHVGFSLDGTKEINDSLRVRSDGLGTYDVVMEKLSLCRKKGLSVGCIAVGTRKHIGKIPQLYKLFCDNHINFKFNPLFKAGEAENHKDEFGITVDEYAQMAIELFDLWFDDDKNRVVESNFMEIASNIITGHTSSCMFGMNCQDNFIAVSPTGYVVPCGRFCDENLLEYAYGNLHEQSLTEIIDNSRKTDAYKRWESIEKGSCKRCEFFDICHGGCMHDGFLRSGDLKHKTFLCGAYKKIFRHIKTRLQKADMIKVN